MVGYRTKWSSRADAASTAARQVASLFALSGLLAFTAIPSQPDRVGVLVGIALGDLAIALAALVLPWWRWGSRSTALLAVPGCVILGASTWAFGDFAAGVGPFYILLFVWLGLHHSQRIVLAVAPVAALAYATGLVAAGADARLLSSTLVLIPIAVAVGLIIANRVARLAEVDRWRKALVATLAHDVRAPLTTVRGALEIIDDDTELPDRLKPMVTAASRQVARITALANNLLDLERVDQGRLRLDMETVDLHALCIEVAELSGAEGIEVNVEPGLEVAADRMRLEQMLINLTTNAVRHGVPPVVIDASGTGRTVTISVRDHGDGVPPNEQPRLFERLSPVDKSPESVGLGLWIVKTLAQAHGGDVGYRVTAAGPEFRISLPSGSRTTAREG
jgi:signal transduction histidine kinase